MELNALIQSFVEDCREHLDNIESSLMDMEAAGTQQDPELVNNVFRLAHSIKGGAGMLGLDNIKALAHKLENVLHMVRSDELVPSHEVVDVLLKGFDRLTFLVDNIHESETHSIDAQVAQLMAISRGSGQPDEAGTRVAPFEVGKTGILNVDAQSLEQATKGGNELYLLEFDLIHDIHGKGRMPFDVMKALTDTGRIVDCKVDFAAVGDLDSFGNSIPFHVLFATILEPKYISGLVHLPDDRVRHVEDIPEAVSITNPGLVEERFGELTLRVAGGAGRLELPEEMTLAVLKDLREALLAGKRKCQAVVIDWARVTRGDVFFFQMLLAARRSYDRDAKSLMAASALPGDLLKACRTQGFGDDASNCLLSVAA